MRPLSCFWWFLILFLASSKFSMSVGRPSRSTLIPLSDQQKLSLTIYEGKMVLVKDKRKVPWHGGVNKWLFENVSAEILPNSALVRLPASDQDLNVLEQSFHFNPLDKTALLRASVGLDVLFPLDHQLVKGTLLVADAPCLIQRQGHVYSVLPQDIVFDGIPRTIFRQPTLAVTVENPKNGGSIVELSYLATGLSWHATYIAELNPEGTAVDLAGWATVVNDGTTNYHATSLNLVAAEIDWTLKPTSITSIPGAPPSVFKTQRILGSPVYTIRRPVSLAVGEEKQISLMRVQDVRVDKTYFIPLALSPSKEKTNIRQTQQVETWFSFNNARVMKEPIPGGPIRLYRRDENGSIQFLGGDILPPTSADGVVELRLGNSQNVNASLTQTDYKVLGKNAFEVGYRLLLTSVQKHPVSVAVKVPIKPDARIIKESLPRSKAIKSDDHVLWNIPIQANGQNELRFRFRVNSALKPGLALAAQGTDA